MASYQTFTTSRLTIPDPVALLANVRTAVADSAAAVAQLDAARYLVKKATAFSAGDQTAAQNAIDTTQALTPQLAAQNQIDRWPIEWRALALALLDQINTIRAALPTPLTAITPAQALAAIRTKAGTLS
jgi:hypothetical protein